MDAETKKPKPSEVRRTPGKAEGEDGPVRISSSEPGPTPGVAEGDLETAEQNERNAPRK